MVARALNGFAMYFAPQWSLPQLCPFGTDCTGVRYRDVTLLNTRGERSQSYNRHLPATRKSSSRHFNPFS